MSLTHPQRRRVFAGSRERGLALLANAPFVHLATTTEQGVPVFRTFNAVVLDNQLYFHGAAAGEKKLALGRPCVVAAEEHVAQIPSHFVDPERACPATTFYRSVQAHGTLEKVTDQSTKAAVLAALMGKHQPEGGYVPLAADHPLYQKEIAGILVVGVDLAVLELKEKLGQNRTDEDLGRLIAGLWKRGESGDLRAIEWIRHVRAEAPLPPVLRRLSTGALAVRFSAHEACDDDHAARATALLTGAYWLDGLGAEAIQRSHRASSALVAAWDDADADGTGDDLLGSARAISDEARTAWIYDVIVRRSHRGRGIGKRLVELLLAHPKIRDARVVRLGTKDAQAFYASFGFEPTGQTPTGATEMALFRR
jgi:nitroimidazol reductase NimA-like FMN-containing flavoprotein (pyridoxamine 5'-phosphate oxidase superfamily)/GNAT superfamily N-acetyltransferase